MSTPRPGERGLTTRGRSLVAGGLAAVICALLLDERDLLRVGVLAAALPLAAAAVIMGRRLRVRASHRVLPDRLHPGLAGSVELTLSNTGTLRTRPVEVTDQPVPGLTDGVRCLLPPLRAGSAAVVRYPLAARRRGRFTIGSVHLTIADPFGLFVSRRSLDAVAEVLVLPTVIPLSGIPPAAGARSAAAGATASGTTGGDPDARVRPYAPGDDIRTIHWSASARRGDLVVRTREPVSHGSAAVMIDHRAAAYRGEQADEALEMAVTLAASISLHLLAADHQLRLTGHGGEVIAAGNDIADDVLVGLADLVPDDRPLLAGATGATGTPGLVIAVLGRCTPAEARLIAAARPRSARGIAFAIEAPSAAPSSTAVALRAAGWRVATVKPGDDPAAAWAAAIGAGRDRQAS